MFIMEPKNPIEASIPIQSFIPGTVARRGKEYFLVGERHPKNKELIICMNLRTGANCVLQYDEHVRVTE